MENLHKSVMIKEIISFLPLTKSINVIDATFGGGGYSKIILENLAKRKRVNYGFINLQTVLVEEVYTFFIIQKVIW